MEEHYRSKLGMAKKSLEEEKERLKRREAKIEESLYSQRQAVLNEIELLKTREMELKRQTELNRRCNELKGLNQLMVSGMLDYIVVMN